MAYYSLVEEVPSYFSSASDFVNSSIVPSQLIAVFCPLKELLRVNIFFVGQQFICFY